MNSSDSLIASKNQTIAQLVGNLVKTGSTPETASKNIDKFNRRPSINNDFSDSSDSESHYIKSSPSAKRLEKNNFNNSGEFDL